ncbi:MAG: HAMP domain-containing histidine kinase [Candidatus Thiodiazotropha sp. (ex. Lucinisca nassula)]|nr:HAMP domain-containing histidine kinase [Candidatus Thiodiazotropha sp. (ex. Lucinisca nassula)]
MREQQGICSTKFELLEILDFLDPLMIIDRIERRVAWISKKFSSILKGINVGDNLNTVCRTLTVNSINNTCINTSIFDTGLRNHHIFEINNGDYVAEVHNVNKSISVIRLRCFQIQMLANSRHLQDREKLLFTSRSITVSEMASTLAHELNQPIGALSNLIFGIKFRLESGSYTSEVATALDKSVEQIKYTSDIITRIRDFTRSREPTLTSVKIRSLVNKCISLMDWEVKNINIDFCYYEETENISILGDEVMLQQVIVNLIRNGIDAGIDNTNTKTNIRITTLLKDKYIEILITDNGKGMTEKDLDNIFIPFASNKSSGMGIGLNICRSFIELHKGKLWLSQNSDKGCTSHIMLPLMS